ncbi:unnamed protein product [Oncorhynchus mykiss]|uniref:Bromo domain-containing protein n=1 Tax=Oncorhynchus mykiss TaxID=8022 RepID=A0A060WDT3_ONCMY|nr:unnamed protein product [Oncorhynchus mykiss]
MAYIGKRYLATEEEEKRSSLFSYSVTKKGRTAVKPPVPTTKGSRSNGRTTSSSSHSTPRSQHTTPKQALSAGKGASAKSSGKKPTPVSNKPTPVSNGRRPPRPGSRVSSRISHEILASSGRNLGVHELSACEHLTVELVRHEDSWPFMKLVSRIQVPDYFDIIKRPIALSTIREKVNNCEYKTATEYIEDVELMFANCLQYNPRHTNEAKAGARLQAFFNSEVSNLGLADRTTPPQKRPRM